MEDIRKIMFRYDMDDCEIMSGTDTKDITDVFCAMKVEANGQSAVICWDEAFDMNYDLIREWLHYFYFDCEPWTDAYCKQKWLSLPRKPIIVLA